MEKMIKRPLVTRIKLFCISTLTILSFSLTAQNILTYTAKDNLDYYIQLDHVVVENLTQNWTDTLYFPDTILYLSGVGIEDYQTDMPFSVAQNVPNPFEGTTSFSVTLPYQDKVDLNVFDISGRLILQKCQQLGQGIHHFQISLSSPQTYLLTVKTSKDQASIKMLNQGQYGLNRIEHQGNTTLSNSLKWTRNGVPSFEDGDLIRSTGVVLMDDGTMFSSTLEQPQNMGDVVTFTFEPYETSSSVTLTETIFIPDGENCGNGCFIEKPFLFTHFAPGATIQSPDDIQYIRLKMEHARISDLNIAILCPDGHYLPVLSTSPTYTPTLSSCAELVDDLEPGWHTTADASLDAHMGLYNENDGIDACDTAVNPMGICWNYCWSNSTTNGYQYACGNAYVYEDCNHISAANPYASATSLYVDSTDVANMVNVYHLDRNPSNLIGCPMNGVWTIRVIDYSGQMNGYIEEMELALQQSTNYKAVSTSQASKQTNSKNRGKLLRKK